MVDTSALIFTVLVMSAVLVVVSDVFVSFEDDDADGDDSPYGFIFLRSILSFFRTSCEYVGTFDLEEEFFVRDGEEFGSSRKVNDFS